MVEGQVKEQRLARDGPEPWWEVHEVGLLGDEGRVQAKGLKPFNQRLEDISKHQSEGPQWIPEIKPGSPARATDR